VLAVLAGLGDLPLLVLVPLVRGQIDLGGGGQGGGVELPFHLDARRAGLVEDGLQRRLDRQLRAQRDLLPGRLGVVGVFLLDQLMASGFLALLLDRLAGLVLAL